MSVTLYTFQFSALFAFLTIPVAKKGSSEKSLIQLTKSFENLQLSKHTTYRGDDAMSEIDMVHRENTVITLCNLFKRHLLIFYSGTLLTSFLKLSRK